MSRSVQGAMHRTDVEAVIVQQGGVSVDPRERYQVSNFARALIEQSIVAANDIVVVCSCYRQEFPYLEPTAKDMFLWFKQSPLNLRDLQVLEIYLQASFDYLKPHDSVRCSVFSKLGRSLSLRLRQWKGNAGNSIPDILWDYFSHVIPSAVSFNSALLLNPRSLLLEYGWSLWMEFLDSSGGEHNYLVPSLVDARKSKSRSAELLAIHQERAACLQAGDIARYDELGIAAGRLT